MEAARSGGPMRCATASASLCSAYRLAGLRSGSGTPHGEQLKNEIGKGDVSIEVKKGTFLKLLDTLA